MAFTIRNDSHVKVTNRILMVSMRSPFPIAVYQLGGCRHFRVQPGKRGQLQRHLQLLRQDVPVQEHARNTSHSCRDTR